jgi:hypothetical protein
MKKIRRRLSQTFRFSIEGSLSELAEHLTIDDSGNIKENGKACVGCSTPHCAPTRLNTSFNVPCTDTDFLIQILTDVVLVTLREYLYLKSLQMYHAVSTDFQESLWQLTFDDVKRIF